MNKMMLKILIYILLLNSYTFSGLDINLNKNHLLCINNILRLDKISNITITYNSNKIKPKYITLKINIPI